MSKGLPKPKDKRQSFTFYRSFYDAIKTIECKEQQADLYDAIFALCLDFEEPKDESKLHQLAWTLIKPNCVKSCINYINGSKPKRSGGGSESEAVVYPSSSISISNSLSLSSKEKKDSKSKNFVIPTLEEIESYIKEKRYSFDAEAFYSYYESVGWKVGRNEMKSWKAACVTWQKKQKEYGCDSKPVTTKTIWKADI